MEPRAGRSRQALQNLQVLWDLHGAAAACTFVALRRLRRRRTVALRARAGEDGWQRNAHRLSPELFLLFVRSAAFGLNHTHPCVLKLQMGCSLCDARMQKQVIRAWIVRMPCSLTTSAWGRSGGDHKAV
jgi:hypothetical protein